VRRTWLGDMLMVRCVSRDAALELAELDLINSMTPLSLEVYGARLDIAHILRLLFRRWEGRERGRGGMR
jgi:hypothetical protein